jgi:hypothetical protein
MITFKFYGAPHNDANHAQMQWAVMPAETDGANWEVLESYDNGKTWLCNCIVPTEQAGWDFIAAWFAQWYE